MKLSLRACIVLLATLLLTGFLQLAPPLRAEPAAPAPSQAAATRVATVDPARVFNDMQETKDLQTKIDSENQRLNAESNRRAEEIKKLRTQRDQIKPDHPQYNQLDQQILKKSMELESWGKFESIRVELVQKRTMKKLFERVQAAVENVAKQKGIDIVIADQRPQLPGSDKSMAELKAAIYQRNVLYAARNVDISEQVVNLLDAEYKANPNKIDILGELASDAEVDKK